MFGNQEGHRYLGGRGKVANINVQHTLMSFDFPVHPVSGPLFV